MSWFSRRSARERDLKRELEAHLELEVEERKDAGVPAEEARLAARRTLGNVTSVQEETREAWGWAWLERFVQDVLYGLRSFKKTPTFTTVVVLTLALGIGATSAIFSIVDAVLLQPLPYRDSNKLVVIWRHPTHNKGVDAFDTYRDFEAWKSRSHSFEQLAMATWARGGKIFSGRGSARGVMAMPASLDFFTLLGVPPELGSTFQKDDLNRGCTVVLRHRFWKSALGGDNAIIGKSIRLDDQNCTVVGVMPPDFTFYPDVVSMWLLVTPGNEIVRDAGNSAVGVFGRLRPGVSIGNAEKEVRSIYADVHRHDIQSEDLVPAVHPLQKEFTFLSGANLRLSLLVLFGAVSFVLLIACVNVANLLLGRSLGREKEFAVRFALGAGRVRLIRQLLTEGLLLSFSGALLGIGLAIGVVHIFRVTNPIAMPPGTVVSVNMSVLAFTAGLAVLTALLFGLVPAWKASQVDLNESLKAASRGASRGLAARSAGKALVVVEVMLSLVLLAGAGLLIKSAVLFASVPLGFSTDHVSGMGIELPSWRYLKPEQRGLFYDEVLRKANQIPGIGAVTLTTFFPLWGGGQSIDFSIEGRPAPSRTNQPSTLHQAVTPGYMKVMKVALLKGRNFDGHDRRASEPVVMINQQFAKKYFPHESPIGQHIKIGESGDKAPWLTVVGVTADQKDFDFFHEMSWANDPMLFRPVSQEEPFKVSVFLRGSGNLGRLQAAVRKQILAIDRDVPVTEAETLRHRYSKVLAYPRFRAVLLGVFAGLALLLASVGLYGVLSQLVAQRTHEIGIRMALGAQKADVLLLIVRQGMVLAGLGITAGLAAAWFLTRFLRSLLYRPDANDILTLAGVSFLLLFAAFLAAYIPARRAARVDPTVVLRYE